jgi:hypothetical protein
MFISREGNLVTLINVFETKPESIHISTKWSISLSGQKVEMKEHESENDRLLAEHHHHCA